MHIKEASAIADKFEAYSHANAWPLSLTIEFNKDGSINENQWFVNFRSIDPNDAPIIIKSNGQVSVQKFVEEFLQAPHSSPAAVVSFLEAFAKQNSAGFDTTGYDSKDLLALVVMRCINVAYSVAKTKQLGAFASIAGLGGKVNNESIATRDFWIQAITVEKELPHFLAWLQSFDDTAVRNQIQRN